MELMKNVQGWTEGVEVDHQALSQIRNIAGLPIVAGHVAIMPDVHLGKGATVGSVIPTRGAATRAQATKVRCAASRAAGALAFIQRFPRMA